MKKIILLFVFALTIQFVNAQDVLIKTNGENLTVKVQKISDVDIEYKLFSNLDGPVYSIKRTEVFQIRYQNGSVENISVNSGNTDNTNKSTPDLENKSANNNSPDNKSISSNSNLFVFKSPWKKTTYNGKELRRMTHFEFITILKEDNRAISTYRTGNALSLFGSGVLIAGSIADIAYLATPLYSYGGGYYYYDYLGGSLILLAAALVNLPCQLGARSLHIKSMRVYNSDKGGTSLKLSPTPIYGLNGKCSPGFNLRMTF